MKYFKAFSFNKRLISVAIASVFFISACGEETNITSGEGFNKDTNTDFDQGMLVTSIVDNVITPTYQQFASLATSQKESIAAYCEQEKAFNSGDDSTLLNDARTAAQNSWRIAMNSWQLADMMQFEPLLRGDGALRNNIYSWPTKNTCGVDLDVTYFKAGNVNGQAYDIAARTASRKSLVALEYLLFNNNLAHSCSGTTKPTSWNNQTEEYRKVARCEFAVEVATDIENNAEQLLIDWLGADNKSGYAAKLKAAGEPGSEFDTAHDAVNKLSDALFYLDKYTKDAKIAEPLGLFANDCGAQACPDSVESKYSEHSLKNIENNLRALKMFMQGSNIADNNEVNGAVGFRDYLIDVGDLVTADNLDEYVSLAIENTKDYQESLSSTLATNPDKVLATHGDVKAVTDKLKSDFITSLALELPKTSAGDND